MSEATAPSPRCWSRSNPSAPWSESALTFGDASLLVRPTDGRDDVWVNYGDVSGVEEIGEPGPHGHVVEVVRAAGPPLQLALPGELLERFLDGLRRSVDQQPGTDPTTAPDPASGTAGRVEPPQSSEPRASRTRLIVLLVVLVLLAVVLVALIVLRPGDEEAASVDGSAGADAPDTTAVATTGSDADGATPPSAPASDPDDPASVLALDVRSARVGPPDQPPTVYISTAVENLSETTVDSYGVNFAVVVEVEPERPVAAVFSLDCADAALGAGETREGAFRVDDATANATGLADCTIAGWPVDTDDDEQVAVHAGLLDGIAADVGAEITRVVLGDGSTLEEADDA